MWGLESAETSMAQAFAWEVPCDTRELLLAMQNKTKGPGQGSTNQVQRLGICHLPRNVSTGTFSEQRGSQMPWK